LVGIDLMFGGFRLIGIALAAGNIDGIATDCGWARRPPP
jgi:hypothetical protein